MNLYGKAENVKLVRLLNQKCYVLEYQKRRIYIKFLIIVFTFTI